MTGSIKRLPHTLCSSVRSGFIIPDLITVVEELVYNSLDAGANKVLVSVGVDSGYVKVEDNGFGISRDGLVLLGERYTTSKCSSLPNSVSRSFGNRGEALCSIADVSLLEITSKAQGRPNAYRKVIKGSKCLYLGIDADRRDMGTSVIVHDIFYNQPVRKTHMQISPKKVLHSIRKCVLQITIVRPEVSFSVVDVESGDELLCTHASSSALPILRGQFGINVSLLHELSLSEGPFELTGYVSNSVSSFSTKAIQFVYINSRFIDKSPIHKVLNRMASTCWEQSDHNKFGKRSRSQACASYCLNLTCPEFLFDIHLQQVKTCAEFKDWQPVLSLIEKSVGSLWNTEASYGEIFGSTVDSMRKNHARKEAGILASSEKDADVLDMYELPRKRLKTQSNLAHQHSLYSPLFPMERETQEISRSSHYQDCEAATISAVSATKRISGLELGDDFYCTYPSRSHTYADQDCSLLASRDFSLGHPWDINDNEVSVSEDLPENIFTERHDSLVKNCFGSREMAESPTRIIASLERNREETSPEIALPTQFEDDQKPFLQEEWLLDDEERSKFHIDHLNADKECVNSWGDQLPSISHGLIPFLDRSNENLSPVRKYDRLLEDHICWQRDDESTRPIVFSPECNETEGSYVPSDEHSSRLFLRNCNSLQKAHAMQFVHTEWPHFEHEHRTEGGHSNGSGGLADGMKFHGNQNVHESTLWLGDASIPEAESDIGERSPFLDQEYAASEYDRCHPVQQAGASYGSFQPPAVECKPTTSASSFGAISWDLEHDNLETHGLNYGSRSCANFKQFKPNEEDFIPHDLGEGFECKSFSTSSFQRSCLSGQCEKSADEICRHFGRRFSGDSSARKGCFAAAKTDLSSEETDEFMLLSSTFENRSMSSGKEPQIHLPSYNVKRRAIAKVRSSSAPPIYRGKKKFVALIANSATVLADPDGCTPTVNCGIKQRKCTEEPLSWLDQFHGTSHAGGSTLCTGKKMKETTNMPDVAIIQNDKKLDSSSRSSDTARLETKWRNGGPQAGCVYPDDLDVEREKLMNFGDKYTILDVSSGILHLSSDTIVPKSISRMCFEDSKVLLQVDKKFIPIVAGKTLAVLDQHAADERIRLEELRNEVLSGKRKTKTYLEEEREMILPETAYQLLHNYSDHIQNWGWTCNIHEDSQSFSENLSLLKRKPRTIKLLTVPCILDVNLSDTDLLEFLEQLDHTDGSSTVPPSVLRVLNNKACRGAIMFGDSLLPSECALIFEELKKTSLCFQCAHGRPTMAPLVNLVALHEQIEKLSSYDEGSSKPWHGLRRHAISLDRAKQRLGS